MPRNPIDYSKTVFYKLVCKDITITDIYVGSTTDFKTRKNSHKSDCNNEKGQRYSYKVYTFIRDNEGWENWDMVMIHRQSCADELEAHKMERDFIETLGATLNSNVPSRNQKQYRQTETYKEAMALYYKANKDKKCEAMALYYEANKDKKCEAMALYYKANKDAIKIKIKIYREANKDAIKASKKLAYEKKKLLKQESLGVLI